MRNLKHLMSLTKPANAMMARYQTDADVEKAFAELNTYWENLLSKYVVESSNDKVNRMVNISTSISVW